MARSLKNICLPVIMLLCSTVAWGYNVRFSNVTERILVLCYKLQGLSTEYFQLIPPDQSVSYYFPNLHCFGGSILWAEYKEKDALGRELPFRGGIDLVDPVSGEILKGEAQALFKQHLESKYAFVPMQIKVVDDETFQITATAAEELTEGIDTFACQTIETVKGFTTSAGSPTSGGMGTAGNTMNSPIASTKDSLSSAVKNKFTQIFSKLKKKAINALSGPERPEGPQEFNEDEWTKINQTDEDEAIELVLNSKINTLMDTTSTSANSMNSMNNTKEPAKTQICRFGLSKIVKGSAALAGTTLCRDLHFVIVDTGEVGSPAVTTEDPAESGRRKITSRVKKPILIAEINQGG